MTEKKAIIFDQAINLIAKHGYESLNLRELAKKSGIKAASIYNHFLSKHDILDTIYNYYVEHFLDNQKSDEEIKNAIRTGNKYDIIDAFTFTFENENEVKYHRMVLITKIIYSRIYVDAKAADVFFNVMIKDREAEVEALLKYGIEINVFKEFDTKTFASLMCGSLHMMGIKAFVDADYVIRQLQEEEHIRQLLADLLPIKE